jgi:hypothetical protein
MQIYNYNISKKQLIIFIFIFLLVLLIFFIFFSYLIIKILQKSIDDNNIFFYEYNKKTKAILDKYGDYKIKRLYLIRQPLSKTIVFTLNILTLFKYSKYFKEYSNYYPFHTLIVFEIELTNNCNKESKMLLVEKNNSINVTDYFFISNNQETMCFNIKKKNYTLNKLLNKTHKRIGSKLFFNWHVYKNNCIEFTEELLVTLQKITPKIKEFIYRDKIIKIHPPSEFSLHIINSICALSNIVQKYVFDNEFF